MVEVHWLMLHTKYQGSRPCGFRQEDFFSTMFVQIMPLGPKMGQPRGSHFTKAYIGKT